MSEVKFGNREVTHIKIEQGKHGPFKILTTIDGKGKQRQERLYDRSLQELIKSEGGYKFGYELGDSGYPDIVAIEPLNGFTSYPGVKQSVDLHKAVSVVPRSNMRDLETNRNILVQVCIKSAAEVYSGAGTQPGLTDINLRVVSMAVELLKFAEKVLSNKLEDAPF